VRPAKTGLFPQLLDNITNYQPVSSKEFTKMREMPAIRFGTAVVGATKTVPQPVDLLPVP